MSKINILVKNPKEDWKQVTIENELGEFQRIVGGYIETYALPDNMVIICNEEGWLLELPYNCMIDKTDFCGTIIMCKEDGEEFASAW